MSFIKKKQVIKLSNTENVFKCYHEWYDTDNNIMFKLWNTCKHVFNIEFLKICVKENRCFFSKMGMDFEVEISLLLYIFFIFLASIYNCSKYLAHLISCSQFLNISFLGFLLFLRASFLMSSWIIWYWQQ